MPKDNRENQNWKEIKKKIESWAKKAKNSPDLITPIFAHTPINPVETRKDSLLSPLEVSFFTTKYTYLVTLVKKNQNYLGTLYTYLMQSDTEVPLSVDQKTFGLHDYKNICEFISLPNKLFKIKGVRKKIMTFNRTTMTERKFEERVEIWREKQT